MPKDFINVVLDNFAAIIILLHYFLPIVLIYSIEHSYFYNNLKDLTIFCTSGRYLGKSDGSEL